MRYSVYILKCSDSTFYTGSTSDLQNRINSHNHTKAGAKYTRGRRPAEIVYAEKFNTLNEARRREVEIKRLTRQQKIKLIVESHDITN